MINTLPYNSKRRCHSFPFVHIVSKSLNHLRSWEWAHIYILDSDLAYGSWWIYLLMPWLFSIVHIPSGHPYISKRRCKLVPFFHVDNYIPSSKFRSWEWVYILLLGSSLATALFSFHMEPIINVFHMDHIHISFPWCQIQFMKQWLLPFSLHKFLLCKLN